MKWLKCLAVFVTVLTAVLMNSCARDQELVSIEIQPPVETFGAADIPVIANAGSTVQLRALGSFIHPPVTKDITNQVTWTSNTPQMVTVDASGLLTATGLACGNALVSATVTTNHSAGGLSSSGALVTGFMTTNVVCFTGNPTLSLIFAGAGTGTVTSSPQGLSCASSCSTSFQSGTSVTLTATPTGASTFGGWTGCDSTNGQACIVNNLTNNRSVTVTFN
jgi:hypothetical protein